jgi:hypothetical protein
MSTCKEMLKWLKTKKTQSFDLDSGLAFANESDSESD